MLHNMRRNERKMNDEDARKLLLDGEYGVLSTFGEDGYAYGVPVNYAYTDGRIVFHCAADVGHKLANLQFCPKVSFTVVGRHAIDSPGLTDRYESVICFGRAEIVTDDAQKRDALIALTEKYAPDYLDRSLKCIETGLSRTGICAIAIESISGKSNRTD